MVELYYLVYLNKKFSKDKEKFFICTKNRRDEFNKVSVFHGIGYWYIGEISNMFENAEQKDEYEVWIPWSEIDHVQSLMYKQRNSHVKE